MTSILPGPTDRAFFVGQTGSGKTTLMKKLLGIRYGLKQIIVADTKHDAAWGPIEGKRVETLNQLVRYHDPRWYPLLLYQPRGRELRDKELLDAFCAWVYERGNTLLIIDEVTQLVGKEPGPGFLDLITRGRVRGCEVWAGTQRPRNIPVILYTESQHYYVFRLQLEADRKHVASFTHPKMLEIPPIKYGCWHYQVGDDAVQLLR